jgi:hypothetical protein
LTKGAAGLLEGSLGRALSDTYSEEAGRRARSDRPFAAVEPVLVICAGACVC